MKRPMSPRFTLLHALRLFVLLALALGTMDATSCAQQVTSARNDPAWLDTLIPEASFKAERWSELMKNIELRDAQGEIVPLQIYTLGEPDEAKPITISARNQSLRSIMQDLCRQFDVTFSLYDGIAVVGTPAELRHFDTAFSSQFPVAWKFGNATFIKIVLINATASETASFFNKKLKDNHVDRFPIRCVGYANHPITYTGYNLTVATVVAVIAADIGVAVAEVFAEQR
jgi:hypothetical protein